MKKGISRLSLIEIFLFIYILLPSNVYLLGLNLVFLFPLCFIFLWLILHCKEVFDFSIIKENIFYWINILVISIITFLSFPGKGIVQFVIDFAISFIVVFEIYKKKKFIRIIDILIYASLVSCLVGIVECCLQTNIFQTLIGNDDYFKEIRFGIWRTESQFTQPISFGNYLVIMSCFLCYRFNTDLSFNKKKLYKFIYLLYWICSLLTVSRSTILFFIIVQIIFFSYNKKKRYDYLFLGGVCSLCAVCYLAISNSEFIDKLLDSYLAIFSNNNNSEIYSGVGDRFRLYSWVIEDMDGKYLLGVGTKVFEYRLDAYSIKESIEVEYLHYLYYYGIIGLVSLIVSYLSNLIYLNKIKSKGRIFQEEKNYNFNFYVKCFIYIFLIVLFSTTQGEIRKLYNILIPMVIGYNLLFKKGVKALR